MTNLNLKVFGASNVTLIKVRRRRSAPEDGFGVLDKLRVAVGEGLCVDPEGAGGDGLHAELAAELLHVELGPRVGGSGHVIGHQLRGFLDCLQ